MDTNLMIYDMENFLNRYTRFMTKDIYISQEMARVFLSGYQYLFDFLYQNRFLYSNHKSYQKMMDIRENHRKLLKMHNKKFLQRKGRKYLHQFEDLSIDSRLCNLILSDEEEILVIQDKNRIPLIVGKVLYFIYEKKYLMNQILVIVDNRNDYEELLLEFQKRKLEISIYILEQFKESLLDKGEQFLGDTQKYDILFSYLVDVLFPKKKLFTSFYQLFSNYIYLNKDYIDFETFRDYHSYMYKRKFLASKLSLKKFNEQEIRKRRKNLRTILNESVRTKEEVDIANFFYLNSIPYRYDFASSLFFIGLDGKNHVVCYQKGKEEVCLEKSTDVDSTIYLYSSYVYDKNYLEVLTYELIKRRYPLEYVTEDVLYDKLRMTTMDSYFSEFIQKVLIPILDYYDQYHSFENTRLTLEQQEAIISIYLYYQGYIDSHYFIKEDVLMERMRQKISENHYRSFIAVGDIPNFGNISTFHVIPHYPEMEILKENIKLLYDYKNYLYENQMLPVMHSYLSMDELNQLTLSFIKKNLSVMNENFSKNQKDIEVYLYEDDNRLHIYRNISYMCYDILKSCVGSKLLAFSNLKDVHMLMTEGIFTRADKSTLVIDKNIEIPYQEVFSIDMHFDTILLPFLIKAPYWEDLLKVDNDYLIKLLFYVAFNKCRQKIILLCPKSRKNELQRMLGNLRVQYF